MFLLKLLVMWQLKDHVLTQADAGLDTTTYVGLAQRAVAGDIALGPGLYFVSPLYIYFLAALLAVTGSLTAVRVVQIALGTAAVACVFVAANEWFGRRAAWIAAALAALTGIFAFYESLLVQAALDPFLTAGAMAALALALRRGGTRWYAAAGFIFGVQILNRPNIGLFLPVLAIALAATRRWRAALVVAAGAAIALAPIALRNAYVTGDWSPESSHGGLNFYIGNNADADGTYRSVPGITPNLQGQMEDAKQVAERATGRALSDGEVSLYFYRVAWRWITDHPAAAAKLFVRKLSLIFSAATVWLNYSYEFFKHDARTALPLLFVGPWLLIPLGLAGLVFVPPSMTRDYLIWASFVPVYALAVAAFFVADRYTLPLFVPLCATAGRAVDVLVARQPVDVRWPRGSARLTCAVALVALLMLVNRPVAADNGVAEERTRMAERLVSLDRYDEAERWAASAADIDSAPGLVHFRLGQRLLAREQPTRAIRHFETALRFDPGQPEVEFALGEALLALERASEAEVYLKRAYDAGVQRDVAGYDLVRALGATGRRAEAIAVLEQLTSVRADDAEYGAALGDLGIKLGAPRLAATFFERALQARPDFEPARRGLQRAREMGNPNSWSGGGH